MWKVLLLFACVAGSAIVLCDGLNTYKCGPNQVFSNCTNGGCEARNCSQAGKPVPCVKLDPKSCKKGCVCASGYLRASNGTCVLRNQCNEGCGNDPNSHPGCGVNCGRTCSTYKKRSVACVLICYDNGCDCNVGYVYDPNIKKCVLPKYCTPTCGLNEVYSTCTNGGCSRRNCSQLGKPQICIDRTPESCTKGCVCAEGYLRNANGTCVLENQCPQPGCGGDPNAKPGCGINCGRRCSDYKVKNKQLICPRYVCKPDKCDCKDGFVFDDNLKKCVVPEQCTPVCGLNEKFDSCINGGCGHRNCSQVGTPEICIRRTPESCIKGCVCSDGFLRADNGTCILQDQCPASSGCGGDINAHSGCGVNCGKTCRPNQPCPKICKVGGCDCNDGYLYDDNVGRCVIPDDCTPETDDRCPGQNEYYNTCISGCSNQSCSDIGKIFHCPIQPAVCREGCRCKAGFWRNADNICVPESECPTSNNQCKGQNEFFDTCISGCSNQTCDSIGKVYNCPIQPAVCRTGCRCNPGFYRNASNVCVAESKCPTPACPENEIYNRCPTVACEGDNCPKNRNSPQTCPVGIVCDPPRCTCGILDKRDRVTKKCIKAYACPPFKCDGPNEYYDECPAGCPGEKCSDYTNGAKCPPFKIGIVVPCKPACKCNKGYYRNSNNTCVKAERCGPVVTTTNTPVIIETPTTAKPTAGSSGSDAVASLKAGVTIFNGEFLYERLIAEPGTNLITSPYSVFTPLVQLFLYTTGYAFKQLSTVLNVSSKEQIRSAFPGLASSFEGQTSVNLSTAAKVYSDLKYPLSDGFKKDSVDVVHAGTQEVDFSKNTEAANTINSWVESQTNNKIHDLIQPSDLSALTRLVLVNAIYFKGEWHYAFNKTNTIKDANFYLSDGTTKKTNLMYQEGQFNYGEVPELNCTVLQMFYKGDNFSMVVVLPNEKNGLLQVAKNLQLKPNYDKVIGSLSRQKVKVYLPPITIETTTDLSDILKKLGVTKIFDTKDSGLSGLLKTPENTYVSKAIQKAFIEVNEEGSEAAAANGVIIPTRAMPAPLPPPSIVFRADRPFLFYIRLQDTTMFCGAKNDI